MTSDTAEYFAISYVAKMEDGSMTVGTHFVKTPTIVTLPIACSVWEMLTVAVRETYPGAVVSAITPLADSPEPYLKAIERPS